MTEENWTKIGQEIVISYDGKAVLLWFCFPRFYFENVFERQKEKKKNSCMCLSEFAFPSSEFFLQLG